MASDTPTMTAEHVSLFRMCSSKKANHVYYSSWPVIHFGAMFRLYQVRVFEVVNSHPLSSKGTMDRHPEMTKAYMCFSFLYRFLWHVPFWWDLDNQEPLGIPLQVSLTSTSGFIPFAESRRSPDEECDLCKTFSAGGCSCKTGPWSVFNHTSLTTCGNPGYLNHFAMCPLVCMEGDRGGRLLGPWVCCNKSCLRLLQEVSRGHLDISRP